MPAKLCQKFFPSPSLLKPAKLVEKSMWHKLTKDTRVNALLSLATELRPCVTAKEVGWNLRVMAWWNGLEPHLIINPSWLPRNTACGQKLSEETCPCLPGITVKVSRWRSLTIKYNMPDGAPILSYIRDERAFIWQHACDHLDGNIFLSESQLASFAGRTNS